MSTAEPAAMEARTDEFRQVYNTLKAEIGKPSLHAIPESEDDRSRLADFLARFGEPLTGAKQTAVWLGDGYSLADVVRALDQDGIGLADIELRAPTLDDVFFAKTGRSLEGAGEDGEGSPEAEAVAAS